MTTGTPTQAPSRSQLLTQSTLTAEDWEEINQCRRDYNRLGFAYNLAFVKLNNRFPQQQPFEIMDDLLTFTAAQLDSDAGEIRHYVQQQDTISDHQGRIRRYLNLRQTGEEELQLLNSFLFEECRQLEQTSALRAHAAQFLRERRILQPAATTLDRIIGEQRRRARQHIFERLGQSLPRCAIGGHRGDQKVSVAEDQGSARFALTGSYQAADREAETHRINRCAQSRFDLVEQ